MPADRPPATHRPTRRVFAFVGALALTAGTPAGAQLLEFRSSATPDAKMDIVVRGIERRPRASVLEIDVRKIGSSVGSSFFVLCSIAKLAQARGGYTHVVKLEETPARRQMLVGFLRAPDEPPGNADPAFAASKPEVIALERFAPICSQMK